MQIKRLTFIAACATIVIILVTVIVLFATSPSDNTAPATEQAPEAPQATSELPDLVVGESFIPIREDIDFDELSSTNTDTLGYINVPGTAIDLPVVRGIDNVKYLNTDFEGGTDVFGTVFADMFNGDNLTGPVTVLYGHYGNNDEMFSQLHRYKDDEYFDENPDMYLYTPQENYKYQIVAAFTNDNYNLLYEKDYSTPEGMQGFIDHIATTALPGETVDITEMGTDDKYLVLSTCVDAVDSYDNRYVVVGKLVTE